MYRKSSRLSVLSLPSSDQAEHRYTPPSFVLKSLLVRHLHLAELSRVEHHKSLREDPA